VRGNAGLARDALSGPTPDVAAARDDLVEVERAVERASALVRQLLAFGPAAGARARTARPQPAGARRRDAAARARGREVRLTLRLDPEVPPVHADRSQVEQVLMNLVLNGRDAIAEARAAGGEARPAGGALTITTEVESVAGADVRRTGVPAAGPYVRLAVRDDGAGMSDATRARIFEPFFTTKAPDRGTGLGLAAVWGIVRQSGGGIYVESEPGKGSTFSVYLPVAVPRRSQAPEAPAHAAEAPFGAVPAVPEAAPHGATSRTGPTGPAGPRPTTTTVLLAEDDHAVRRVAARILRNAGYRVLEAGDGRSALALWRAHATEVEALVADVRMPQLRGDDLAAAVLAEAPHLPVVLMTGFAEEPTALGVAPVPRAGRLLTTVPAARTAGRRARGARPAALARRRRGGRCPAASAPA
jgi:CheY-like chemotaxis protein